jgi:hypothetical protein
MLGWKRWVDRLAVLAGLLFTRLLRSAGRDEAERQVANWATGANQKDDPEISRSHPDFGNSIRDAFWSPAAYGFHADSRTAL